MKVQKIIFDYSKYTVILYPITIDISMIIIERGFVNYRDMKNLKKDNDYYENSNMDNQ